MRPRNIPLLLAVFACNSDFVFSTLLRIKNPYLTTNWLVLPPVVLYVLLTRRVDLATFTRKQLPIVIAFAACIICQLYNGSSLGEANVASVGMTIGVKQIATCLITFLLFHELISDEGDVRSFLTYTAVSTAINAFLLVAVARGLLPSINGVGWVGDTRVTRFGLGDPNITFCYMAIGAAYWLVLADKRAMLNRRDVMLSILCFAGALLPVILGLSRGAFAALALSAFLGVLLLAWSFGLGSLYKYSLAALVLAALAATQIDGHRVQLFVERVQQISHDFTPGRAQRAESSSQRLFSLEWLVKDIVTSPDLYGEGYGAWFEETLYGRYPHFTPADVYIIGGIVPLLALVYSLTWNMWRLFHDLRPEPDPEVRASNLALCVFVVALLLMTLTVSIAWLKMIWVVFAVMVRANMLTAERRQAALAASMTDEPPVADQPVGVVAQGAVMAAAPDGTALFGEE